MNVTLKTLSPIHIGGKEQGLLPMEYVVFDGDCFVISENRLSESLLRREKLDDLIVEVQKMGGRFALKAFLKRNDLLRRDFLSNVSHHVSACRADPGQRELRPFIRDGFSDPFIPGTSIKGVIRTSLLYVILARLDAEQRLRLLDDFVERRIREFKNDERARKGFRWFQDRFKQWFAQKLDQEIFQKFELRAGQRRYDPHSDLLRAIKVSDSFIGDGAETVVEEIKIFSVGSRESPKRWSIYAECVPEETEFEFEVQVDEGILSDFARMNTKTAFGLSFAELSEIVSDPLNAVRKMTEDVYAHEQRFFRSEGLPSEALTFDEMPNFRIGWGMGLLSTSVDLLLPEQIRRDLRNALFVNKGSAPAPKSRKLIVGDKRKVLGWCKATKM